MVWHVLDCFGMFWLYIYNQLLARAGHVVEYPMELPCLRRQNMKACIYIHIYIESYSNI